MLKKMQEDSHLHSGQRWELSQILECGPLYKDIEKAVKEMKEAQAECWLPMDSAPKDVVKIFAYNPMFGAYRTHFDGRGWPKNGWGDKVGVWYPAPYGWMPYSD